MEMQDYNVSTTSSQLRPRPSVAVEETSHNRNQSLAANSLPTTLGGLWKLYFRPSSPCLRRHVHLLTSFTNIPMVTKSMYCFTQHWRIEDAWSLTTDQAEDTNDGEEDDTDHASFEDCDNLGDERFVHDSVEEAREDI